MNPLLQGISAKFKSENCPCLPFKETSPKKLVPHAPSPLPSKTCIFQ